MSTARDFLVKQQDVSRLHRNEGQPSGAVGSASSIVKGSRTQSTSALHRDGSLGASLREVPSLKGTSSLNPLADALQPVHFSHRSQLEKPVDKQYWSPSSSTRNVRLSIERLNLSFRERDASHNYQQMEKLMDRYWQFQLKMNPERATILGIHKYDKTLSSISEASWKEEMRMVVGIETSLRNLLPNKDAFQGWTRDQVVSFQLFREEIFVAKSRCADRTFLMPLNEFKGPHLLIPEAIRHMNFNNRSDFETYKARLTEVLRHIDDIVKSMKTGLVEHITPPQKAMERVLGDLTNLILAEPSVFQMPINQFFLSKCPDDATSKKLKKNLERTISLKVLPAFARLANFTRDVYIPALRTQLSIKDRLPRGEWVYDNSLRRVAGRGITAPELHQKGLAEVQRIYTELQKLALASQGGDSSEEASTLDGAVERFVKSIRENPRKLPSTKEVVLDHYRSALMQVIPTLTQMFNSAPPLVPGVRETPELTGKSYPLVSVFAHQPKAAKLDHILRGWLEVNCKSLSAHRLYEAHATVLRLVAPGAFLVESFLAQNETIPDMRRVGRTTETFREGWSHYVECLALELELPLSAEAKFGVLERQLIEAVTLVVSTGIHDKGWNEEEALEYCSRYVKDSEQVAAILRRTLSFAAKCCAPKIGQLKIKELREVVQQQLGDSFSLRSFHDLLMALGPLPLHVLDQVVREWATPVVAPVDNESGIPEIVPI